MKIFALLFTLGWLTSCTLLEPGTSTLQPQPSSTFEPITVDLYLTIADAETDEPVVADTVWVNNEIAYRQVNACVLILFADYPPQQDGYQIRIKAKGYELWSTIVRPHARRSHGMNLTAHLHRNKPQTNSEPDPTARLAR